MVKNSLFISALLGEPNIFLNMQNRLEIRDEVNVKRITGNRVDVNVVLNAVPNGTIA